LIQQGREGEENAASVIAIAKIAKKEFPILVEADLRLIYHT
jgi:hypothetical protein